jgi:minor extracellular serine protease Vpr
MITRVCSVLLLMTTWLMAQTFNKSKIDVRLWETIEQTQNTYQGRTSLQFFKLSTPSDLIDVIVFSNSVDDAKAIGIEPSSSYEKFFTAKVSREQLIALSNLPSTVYIQTPKLRYPNLDKSIVDMKVDKLHTGTGVDKIYKGQGVIVGIIDTGIDWKHLDFRSDSDTTKSRILFLRDLTTGNEFSQAQINNELDGTPANVVDEQDYSGHGTHVASIAAGDGSASGGKYTGVAPEADLIIVKAGDDGFTTDNIIKGIAYIRQKADSLGKPFVINMSLGGHEGSHDGTSEEELAVESELNQKTGRQIVIAAGNEGADSIHADGIVAQSGTKQFQFTIPTYTPNSGAGNDYVVFSMWYNAGDNLTVSIKTPNNTTVTATSGQSQDTSTNQGRVNIYNASNGVNPINNAKECYIEIYDATVTVPASGVWTLTVTGSTVTQGGAFDLWLAGSSMGAEITTGATFTKLVGMPGTAEHSITVGAYASKWSWSSLAGNVGYGGTDRTNNYATFSSTGPTRDGRQKPDISAPGQAIAAAMSSTTTPTPALVWQVAPAGKYVIEQGTSMASPHVAGLVALMLQAKPALTPAQIRSALQSTARVDAYVGTAPNTQWGYGKVDAQAVLQHLLSVRLESTIVPSVFVLHQNYPNPFNPSTKIAFSLPERNHVSLKIYNVLGEEIATPVDEVMNAGEYSVTFNAAHLASGIYFYTLTAGTFSQTKKMLFLR